MGDALCLLSAAISGDPGSNWNHICWGKEPLGLKHYEFTMRDGASPPIPRLGAGSVRGGASSTVHDGMDFLVRSAPIKACEGEMVWFGSRSPSLFIDRSFELLGGKVQKYPGFSHSFDTWKMAFIGRGSQRAHHLSEAGHYSTSIWSWRRTRLAMPKTICAPDSSSLKPGSGATEGVLD